MSENEQGTVLQIRPVARQAEKRWGRKFLSNATATRHATATVLLHWSTVVALVMAVAAIYLRDFSEDKPLRRFLLDMHRQLALLVLIGVPLRIIARSWLGFAYQRTGMATAARWAASMTHMALYASLIVQPIIGLAATSAKGITLRFLGLVPLPSFVAPDPDVADTLLDYHMWSAWVLFALVGAHGAAALWHHFVKRDGVLRAMLPGRESPVRPPRIRTRPIFVERRRSDIPVTLERRRSQAAG